MINLDRQIQASSDDCRRRYTSEFFTTTLYPLVIGNHAAANNKQNGAGLRFQNITIPRGAIIEAAYISPISENNETGTTFRSRIKGEDADNAAAFSTMEDFDGRDRTTAEVDWDGEPAWTKGERYQSPDIKTVIQEIIDRPGWSSGNALVLFWDDFDDRSDVGADRRAEQYDNAPTQGVQLHIQYSTTQLDKRLAANTDDALLYYTGTAWIWNTAATHNQVGWYSDTLLKLGLGLRFLGITIPQAAIITAAHFTVTANYSHDKTVVRTRIKGEDADNPPTFTTKDDFDARVRTTAEVDWDGVPVMVADEEYDSPDIKTVIQEIIDRPGWSSGNAVVIFWDDFDDRSDHNVNTRRRMYTHNTQPAKAPLLHIEYLDLAAGHKILDARYITESPETNRAYVIGQDAEGNPVHGTAVTQSELDLVGERLDFQQLLSIPTAAEADDVADAALAKQRITGSRGFLVIPPNPGVELWDVVRITDELCAQDNALYRIAGFRTEYQPKAARYHQTLYLAAP